MKARVATIARAVQPDAEDRYRRSEELGDRGGERICGIDAFGDWVLDVLGRDWGRHVKKTVEFTGACDQ